MLKFSMFFKHVKEQKAKTESVKQSAVSIINITLGLRILRHKLGVWGGTSTGRVNSSDIKSDTNEKNQKKVLKGRRIIQINNIMRKHDS